MSSTILLAYHSVGRGGRPPKPPPIPPPRAGQPAAPPWPRLARPASRAPWQRGRPGAPQGEAAVGDVDVSAGSAALVSELAAAAGLAGRSARLHLKVDTGMARGGAPAADWPGLGAAALAAEATGHARIAGIWSHLACADIPGHPSIDAQLAAFRAAVELAEQAGARPEVRHLANTPATLTLPQTWFDLVPPGGGGVGPSTPPPPPPGSLP